MGRGLLSLLIVMWLAVPGAMAMDRTLSDQRFDVTIRDQNVREVLQELSLAIGVPIRVSESVQGRVSASFSEATAEDLLDTIARERSLDWRYDGRSVEVTARSEQVTRILGFEGVRTRELADALRSLGVYEDQFPLTAVEGEFGMLVAPPGYVALVEVVLAELIERNREREADAEAEAKRRRAAAIRLDEHRRELDRLEFARQVEAQRLEAERHRIMELERRNTRQGPAIVRNGVWGG